MQEKNTICRLLNGSQTFGNSLQSPRNMSPLHFAVFKCNQCQRQVLPWCKGSHKTTGNRAGRHCLVAFSSSPAEIIPPPSALTFALKHPVKEISSLPKAKSLALFHYGKFSLIFTLNISTAAIPPFSFFS